MATTPTISTRCRSGSSMDRPTASPSNNAFAAASLTMATRQLPGVSRPPNIRPATCGNTMVATVRGVNAATSITTSRDARPGGSTRTGCHRGRLPGRLPTHAALVTPRTDNAAASTFRRYSSPSAGRTSRSSLDRRKHRLAETLTGPRTESGAKAFEQHAGRDHEHTAACHLRHDESGPQPSHRHRRTRALPPQDRHRVIVA